jgi:hypothetical protein
MGAGDVRGAQSAIQPTVMAIYQDLWERRALHGERQGMVCCSGIVFTTFRVAARLRCPQRAGHVQVLRARRCMPKKDVLRCRCGRQHHSFPVNAALAAQNDRVALPVARSAGWRAVLAYGNAGSKYSQAA